MAISWCSASHKRLSMSTSRVSGATTRTSNLPIVRLTATSSKDSSCQTDAVEAGRAVTMKTITKSGSQQQEALLCLGRYRNGNSKSGRLLRCGKKAKRLSRKIFNTRSWSLDLSRPVPACRHIPLRGGAISALSKLPPPRPEDRLLLIADEEAPKELLAAEGRVFHSFKI